MKKLLIVNDNMHIGGIQKSLSNFLKVNADKYDITLLLLYPGGELLFEVPKNVRILFATPPLRPFGAHKSDLLKKPLGYIWKGVMLIVARMFSKKTAFGIASVFQKKIGSFDVAISFSHASKDHDLRSCSAEFVLQKTVSKEKICFIHGDYKHEENRCCYTDALYSLFDKIACCSDSVRANFLEMLPALAEKTYTVRNFYDLSLCDVTSVAAEVYDPRYINLVTIARLTSEKGILRSVLALRESGRTDIRYYVVGDGPDREKIEKTVEDQMLCESVFFMGQRRYPARYIINADFLLVPSYHEAAPMVFDEAKLLGVRIITTNTTSAAEMVSSEDGIICDNSQDGILAVLSSLRKSERRNPPAFFDNSLQERQFAFLLDANNQRR